MANAKHIARLIGLALGLSLFLPWFALARAACTASNFDPSALRGNEAEGDWLVYRNAKNGLSFRYPSSMQVEERNPASFGYDKSLAPDAIVDLQVLGSKGSTVMRFICARGEQKPGMAAVKIRSFRDSAREAQDGSSLTSMQIDGHEAIQAIVGGVDGKGAGAFCSWGVNILQPVGCNIFPLGSSDDSSPPAHDGHFPLLSIIQTVHFEPTKR
jgi:hypothetical protein